MYAIRRHMVLGGGWLEGDWGGRCVRQGRSGAGRVARVVRRRGQGREVYEQGGYARKREVHGKYGPLPRLLNAAGSTKAGGVSHGRRASDVWPPSFMRADEALEAIATHVHG